MSCGAFNEHGASVSFDYEKVMAADSDLIPINFDPDGKMVGGWSGFPIVLHRGDVIDKIGSFPFRPILDDRWSTGMSGEDTSFFQKATAAGLKFVCDRRVEVPHLKYGNPQPDWRMKEPRKGTGMGEIVGGKAAVQNALDQIEFHKRFTQGFLKQVRKVVGL